VKVIEGWQNYREWFQKDEHKKIKSAFITFKFILLGFKVALPPCTFRFHFYHPLNRMVHIWHFNPNTPQKKIHLYTSDMADYKGTFLLCDVTCIQAKSDLLR
jgi:hypothetical protein